ncbi:MAG: hypothetical protein R2742_00785 [Micropruina glycogenica]
MVDSTDQLHHQVVLLLAPSVGTGVVVITSSLVGFVTVPFIGWLSGREGGRKRVHRDVVHRAAAGRG